MSDRRAPLTAAQRELYELIVEIHEHRGSYPSQRELAEKYLGVNLRAVQDRLYELHRRGWLRSPTPAGVVPPEILS